MSDRNRIHVPNSPDALQQALDRSEPGQILSLPTEAQYGPLVLPGRRLDVRIECDDFDARFGHLRRLPMQQALPSISSDSAARWPVTSSFRSAGVTLAGIRIRNDRRDTLDHPTLCVALGFGQDRSYARSYDDLSRDITLEKCDIGGTPGASNTLVGVHADCETLQVRGCRITHVHHGNQESHGVKVYQSRGPIAVEDCEIVAGGINCLVGGESPYIEGMTVCSRGFSFSGNYVWKSPSWFGGDYGVKNLFELKNCWNAYVFDNVFENNWLQNQNGMAILFTPREHNPIMYGANREPRPAPLTNVGCVFFKRNFISNVDGGINISGPDSAVYPKPHVAKTMPIGKIYVDGNVMHNVGAYGRNGRAFQIQCTDLQHPTRLLSITNNSILHGSHMGKTVNDSSLILFEGQKPAVNRLLFERNMFTSGRYGIFATGGKQWAAALDEWCHFGCYRDNLCVNNQNVMETWEKEMPYDT